MRSSVTPISATDSSSSSTPTAAPTFCASRPFSSCWSFKLTVAGQQVQVALAGRRVVLAAQVRERSPSGCARWRAAFQIALSHRKRPAPLLVLACVGPGLAQFTQLAGPRHQVGRVDADLGHLCKCQPCGIEPAQLDVDHCEVVMQSCAPAVGSSKRCSTGSARWSGRLGLHPAGQECIYRHRRGWSAAAPPDAARRPGRPAPVRPPAPRAPPARPWSGALTAAS